MTAWHTLELAARLVPKVLVELGRLEAEGAQKANLPALTPSFRLGGMHERPTHTPAAVGLVYPTRSINSAFQNPIATNPPIRSPLLFRTLRTTRASCGSPACSTLNPMIFSRISFATLSRLSVSRITAAFIVGG